MNKNLCRLCFINPGTISLSEYSSGIQITSKIMYCCTNIRISDEDVFPRNICDSCEKELESAYCFIIKCEETDKKLRSTDFTYLKEESDTKTEVKDELETYSLNEVEDNPYDSSTDIKHEDDLYQEPGMKRKYLKENFKAKKKSSIPQSCTCNTCGRSCQNPSSLTIHMRSHTNERPYPCQLCDKAYKDSGSLKRHQERNHFKDQRQRKFICEICGKGFFSKSDIKIHMRIHTGDMPYACTMCPARFTQVCSLQRHQLRHTGERAHACMICHKKFLTKEELKKHHITHTSTKKYKCPACNTPFKYKNNLMKHYRMHSEVKCFICNYCRRNFTVKGNLRLHIKTQHSSKSGYCNTCLKDVSNIEMHTWKHTGIRPFKCEMCTSSFFERKALTRHVNFKHKFTDKYKCTVNGCTVKVPSQQMLDFHILKYHGNIVPYPCDKCSRGFYRKSDLARHKNGSHKERSSES